MIVLAVAVLLALGTAAGAVMFAVCEMIDRRRWRKL